MFLILLFCSDKRVIITAFLIAGIVQGFESYFDYKIKQGYQDILTKANMDTSDLLKKVVYPELTVYTENEEFKEDYE